MKLYLISQDVNNGCDTYDSAVVCAPDEETARNIDPSSAEPMVWDDGYSDYWCSKPEDVQVRYLGEAKKETELQEVICASYNAG